MTRLDLLIVVMLTLVSANAYKQSGPIGWWKFDEGTGSTFITDITDGGGKIGIGEFTVAASESRPQRVFDGKINDARIYNRALSATEIQDLSKSGTSFTLTVASSNPASGALIAISPADNNSQRDGTTQFTRVYNNGMPVTLVAAVTAGGNKFSSWSGCDSSSGNYCNVTMSADKTVTATYTTLPPAAAWVVEPNQYGRLDVRVIDQAALDALLQSKWAAMKAALRAGDTATAASYFTKEKVAIYKNIFDNFTIPHSQIDSYFGNIVWRQQTSVYVFYTLQGGSDGGTVIFQLEQDNEWRIRFF